MVGYDEKLLELFENFISKNEKLISYVKEDMCKSLEKKEFIGSGTFAKVYKISYNNAIYAAKVTNPVEAEMMIEYLDEIRLVYAAFSAFVVPIYWVDLRKSEYQDLFELVIIMEFMDTTLKYVLKNPLNFDINFEENYQFFVLLLLVLVNF